MNLKKLRQAEALFLQRYPGGFDHEDLQKIGRKHNVDKLAEFTGQALIKGKFRKRAKVLEDIVTIVSRSSMVSMFEKPKFRDFVKGLNRSDRATLTDGFEDMLHGDQERGFAHVIDVLGDGKLARWSIATVCLFYFRPQHEVFVKPTTTKNVIRQFELDDLVYKPRPGWAFYARYRDTIDAMKTKVSPSLSPNNAAFTGFLMMSTSVD
jgi:hypothetical protein